MKTEIIMIVDRSGSMASIQSSAEEGVNNYIHEQRNVKQGEARLTVVEFDDKIDTCVQARPLSDDPAPRYVLIPRGLTALNDAIGTTLEAQGRRIHREKWADLVVVVITTDGGENASHDYTREQVAKMVKHAEKHGWQFIYLGANQDSFAVGASYGMRGNTVSNYNATAVGSRAAYASASMSTTALRAGMSGDSLNLSATMSALDPTTVMPTPGVKPGEALGTLALAQAMNQLKPAKPTKRAPTTAKS